ncbi:unnamed protein product [Urochloa decumbens]|uniref:Uncharacterized protein n=1 Tax=Urochloa decumbens TaxID=240449 RepID=A0ABC8WZG5_9POAL
MRLYKLFAGLAILVALFTGTWPVAVLGRTAKAPPAPRAGPVKHHYPSRWPPPPPPHSHHRHCSWPLPRRQPPPPPHHRSKAQQWSPPTPKPCHH